MGLGGGWEEGGHPDGCRCRCRRQQRAVPDGWQRQSCSHWRTVAHNAAAVAPNGRRCGVRARACGRSFSEAAARSKWSAQPGWRRRRGSVVGATAAMRGEVVRRERAMQEGNASHHTGTQDNDDDAATHTTAMHAGGRVTNPSINRSISNHRATATANMQSIARHPPPPPPATVTDGRRLGGRRACVPTPVKYAGPRARLPPQGGRERGRERAGQTCSIRVTGVSARA